MSGWKKSRWESRRRRWPLTIVLVLDYDGPRWGEATEKAVENFVKSGKGLVAVHAASYAFTGLEVLGDNHRPMGFKEPPWPEYLKMIGGWWTDRPAQDRARAPALLYGEIRRTASTPSPKAWRTSFVVSDELYHSHQMSPGRSHRWPPLSMIPRTAGRARTSR